MNRTLSCHYAGFHDAIYAISRDRNSGASINTLRCCGVKEANVSDYTYATFLLRALQ